MKLLPVELYLITKQIQKTSEKYALTTSGAVLDSFLGLSAYIYT